MMRYFGTRIKRTVICGCAAVLSAGMLCGCSSMRSSEEESRLRDAGIKALALGDYEEAVTDFQNALDQSMGGIGEMELDICLYKAQALYLSGDVDGAYDVYTALINYDQDSDAYYLRGKMSFARGDYTSGEADFEEAIDKDGDNFELFIGIYETMSKFGEGEQAKEYLNQAVKIHGDSAEDNMNRGRVYYYLGDYASAEEYLQKAIDKGQGKASFYLAQVYAAEGETALSDQTFQDYVNSGMAVASDLMQIGENRMNTGDYESALQYFTAALSIDHEDCDQELTRDTIIAYEYNGDFASAKELIVQYMESYPDDYEAEDELEFLETR